MRPAPVVAALVLAALVGCAGHGDPAADSAPTGPSSTASSAPSPASPPGSPRSSSSMTRSPHAMAVFGDLPDLPPAREAAGLAAALTGADRTIRDPGSAEADVRRAALTEQLAARLLAGASQTRESAVLRRLEPHARTQLRADVAAGRELGALTAPQPKLPPWRIVEPPPPAALLRDYRRAERRTGVPWEYLAAIHLVETRMGRIRGTSTAGAQGPMQFLPSTFEQYSPGGDINDPADAIMAAARMLRANGAPGDLRGALYSYNHSDHYVRAVSTYAARMAASPAAYRSYWHWQVLYHRADRTFWLPEGYPRRPAEPLQQG